MNPKKAVDGSWAPIFVVATAIACATVDTKKVTSVVDPDRIDAMQTLAEWKQQADTFAKVAPTSCEPKYTAAQQQVGAWIEGPLATQINVVAAEYYGTVDLGKSRIPGDVTAAVGEFKTCAGDVAERGVEDVAASVLNWASQQAKAERKKSADALTEQIRKLKWASWTDAKAGTPK